MFQQLTGANYFFYYGATIFKSVGISDSFVTQIILGAVNFLCTFLGLYIMEKVRNRAYNAKRPPLMYHPFSVVWSANATYLWRHLAIHLALRLRRCGYRQGPFV
jgi:hypothetical protein